MVTFPRILAANFPRIKQAVYPSITCQVDGVWMGQIARNLTDAIAGPLRGSRYLIVDRDPLNTAHFKKASWSRWA